MESSYPSATMSNQNVTVRVLVAGTGVTYRITLYPAELTVSNIRSHLAAAVPLNDQILLLGPPYKIPKDSHLQSEEVLSALRLGDVEDDPIQEDNSHTSKLLSTTERSGARRLFLFSRQLLSQNAPDPAPCHLQPVDLELPTQAPGPSPIQLDTSRAPPLHQALIAYERQFMLYTAQARVLADGADLRLAACRSCVQEQAVMARALRAAVSNLSDHFHGATRTRADFTATFQTKTAAHAALLTRFESILQGLGQLSLHPALSSVARASGRPMETLLDTVPVDRERAWAQQCQTSHQRLLALFQELEGSFRELATPTSREEDSKRDREAEEEIQKLWGEVEVSAKDIRDRQATRMDRLAGDHREVVKVITDALNTNDEDQVQNAFTPLRELSSASKDIVPSMAKDDFDMKQLMEKVADAKTRAMKRMKVRLRDVSLAQSSIQRVLSSVGVLRDAVTQQTDNMVHLEHVSELQESYRQFLLELRRRRAYGQAVTSSSTAMMERLAAMRDDEIKAREKFLRGPGRHLMPAFFETFAPTLATPPPLYTPQLPAMVELDTLPDVGQSVASSSADAVMQSTAGGEHGVSSASSLTTESHQQPRTSSTGDDADGPQQQDQLIVSADEQSGTDLILDTPADTAAQAEVKTLAYENEVLRQAVEQMGGKPPRAYIDEARTKDTAAPAMGASGLAALRKELGEAKLKVIAATEALENLKAKKEPDDRISHSSFSVGDVGLFMPSGRGSGGKRTYLAFHTKCPHRYLSSDCVSGSPDFIIGRIVYQEELVAGEVGTDANPYGVHVGTKFWVLTAEILHPET